MKTAAMLSEIEFRFTTALFLLLTSLPIGSSSLVLNDVVVPSYIVRGHDGHLRCDYSAAGQEIYAVKWYKDNGEFFRYQPGAADPVTTFPVEGFFVDTKRSTDKDLYLSRVNLQAAGAYKCEVTSGPPTFWTLFKVKQLRVVDLPDSVPFIRGHEKSYRLGDTMRLNCSSYRSYPPVKLDWYINDEPVSRVPWTSVESWTNPEPFSMTTTFSRLTHTVTSDDFNNGVMLVKCTASMNGTEYWEVNEIAVSLIVDQQAYSELSASTAAAAANKNRPRWSILQVIQILAAVLVMLLA